MNRKPSEGGVTGDLEMREIKNELWREYDFEDSAGNCRIYRINKPKRLYFRPSGTTHRVVDADGVTHCIPAPGYQKCVLRWFSPEKEVEF
jgi:hypothetical protein